MKTAAIAASRLQRQRLTHAALRRPEDVVTWFGAVQAQEFAPAKWAIGLRLRDGATDHDVARAIDDGRILRTHVLRPTWHFVTPADIGWMLELTAPSVRRRMANYWRQMKLDAATFTRGIAIIERTLGDRGHLTRRELGEALRQAGMTLHHIPLAHLSMYAELEGVICSGPRQGLQSTYALLQARVAKTRRLDRDEALATLAARYFQSHGPATIRDFVWWSGLATPDAKRGLEMNKARREEIDGLPYWTIGPPPRGATRDALVYLLPIYDEYVVAYRDREAVPHLPAAKASGNRPFVSYQHTLVIGGQIAGTWRTTTKARGIEVAVFPRRRLRDIERRGTDAAVDRFERFSGRKVLPGADRNQSS